MKDEYKKLRMKYNLPSYNELNNHFELDYIEEDAFLIRSVRRRIHEKVVFFAKIFEKVLFPNQTVLMEMYETKFFTEKEKEDLFKAYDELLVLDRRALSLNVSSTNSKEAEYINLAFKKWPRLTKKSQFVIEKLDSSWKDKKADLSKNHYFG